MNLFQVQTFCSLTFGCNTIIGASAIFYKNPNSGQINKIGWSEITKVEKNWGLLFSAQGQSPPHLSRRPAHPRR